MELITSTLSALPETPDQIKYFAEKAKAELLNGQIDFRTLQYQKTCIERKYARGQVGRNKPVRNKAKAISFYRGKNKIPSTSFKRRKHGISRIRAWS